MKATREIATEYRLSHWAMKMRERQESGLSIKGYCEREGIHANVYHYWQRKLRESAAAELLPTTTQNSLRAGGWMEVSVGESTKKSGLKVEVSGCQIEVSEDSDMELLKKVCKALSGLC